MLNEHEAVWKHWAGSREEEQFPASSLVLMRGLARLHRNGSPGPGLHFWPRGVCSTPPRDDPAAAGWPQAAFCCSKSASASSPAPCPRMLSSPAAAEAARAALRWRLPQKEVRLVPEERPVPALPKPVL